MSPWFYVIWYSGATLLTLLVWVGTARLRSPRGRLAIRLAAFAFGFTTVPFFGPDGGAWIPIGLYYLTNDPARFEAWRKATLVIGAVWVILFAGALALDALRSAGRRA